MKTNIKVCGNCIHFISNEDKNFCDIKQEIKNFTDENCIDYEEFIKNWDDLYFLGYDY